VKFKWRESIGLSDVLEDGEARKLLSEVVLCLESNNCKGFWEFYRARNYTPLFAKLKNGRLYVLVRTKFGIHVDVFEQTE
jgi:hypothetical protein